MDTLDDECIFETTVVFATNANLVCEVRVGGVSTVVQVTEMTIRGVVRVTLAPLTAHFPCFAGVHCAIMDKVRQKSLCHLSAGFAGCRSL